MGKFLLLCGAFLCLSLTATANDSSGALGVTGAASDPSSAAPVPFIPADREPWQVGIGFQYDHFNPYNINFHNLGYHADVTRYLKDWLGVEGAVQVGFGHTGTAPAIPRALDAKSLFLGAGPHISIIQKDRLEPWVHVLVGMEHFRFTQTNNTLQLGSNTALGIMAGGGVDFKILGRLAWRVQGDYLGTRFQSKFQTNYSVGTGVVFNF